VINTIKMDVRSLTQNEKKILEFIEEFINSKGISPTYSEIKEAFGFSSYNSVQRYIHQLQDKGYVKVPGNNQKRAIKLLQSSGALRNSLSHIRSKQQTTIAVSTPTITPGVDGPRQGSLSLPMLGRVAAGRPIEALTHEEFQEVPTSMVRHPDKCFTLEVRGNSMIGDSILDRDVLIVQSQKIARNGEIAVCLIDQEATVKRYYLHQGSGLARPQVELRPANPELESQWYPPDQVEIRGIVVGLLRKF